MTWQPRAGLWCLPVLCCVLVAAGCTSVGPAPVESRDGSQRVPAGYYRVRPGDNLYRIALAHGLNYRTVARWNGIKPPYAVKAGRLLRVTPPGRSTQVAAAQSKAAEPSPQAVQPSAPRQAAPPEPRSAPVREQARPDQMPKPPQAAQAAPKAAASAPHHTRRAGSVTWSWPLRGSVVQNFRRGDRTHQGIRIKGSPGETVFAAAAGKVVYSGSGLKGYGNLIIVKHNNNYLSAYGFNRRLLVKEGDRVSRGQPLAEVGRVPGGDYGLHFEIRKNGRAVNPLSYLPGTP